VGTIRFSEDPDFDFAVRCLLTGVGYGMAEPGEIVTTAETIVPHDRDSWFEAWTALGERCERIGTDAAERGHRTSASGAFLRAANYRFAGFYYVLGTRHAARHVEMWHAHRRALLASFANRSTDILTLEVPWDAETLPAWFVPAAGADTPRPLMMIHGGLGSPLSDTVMTGLADADERGWHTLIFDGPGQGRTRFSGGLCPVRDWGAVGRNVLDAALALDGIDTPRVDPRRIVAAGISDGGFLAARHAAADPRVSALVCDPGVLRPIDGVLGGLRDAITKAWATGGSVAVDRAVTDAIGDADTCFAVAKATEQWPDHSLGQVLDELSTWTLDDAVADITVPTIICDPDAAMSFPGQSAELAHALRNRATLLSFTTAEGAGLDCEIGAPKLRNQRVFDELEDLLEVDLG
jgi:pimeloyl-ACP methyl ester carboxylesterase